MNEFTKDELYPIEFYFLWLVNKKGHFKCITPSKN